MHEVEMATRVLNAVRKISAEKKLPVLEVNLKVGEINEPSALKLWLKKLGGGEFRSTKFKIQRVPISVKCRNCGYAGKAKSIDTHLPDPKLGISCPKCGKHDLALTSGQELEIENVKLGSRRRND